MRSSFKLAIAFIFFLFIFVQEGTGQNIDSLQKNKADTLKLDVDHSTVNSNSGDKPQPAGGSKGYLQHVQNHIHYPQKAVDAGASGMVYVSIIVNTDGTITNVKLEKDNVGYGCGEESVRVIKLMPPWKPEFENGKPVRVRYIVPVQFTLR